MKTLAETITQFKVSARYSMERARYYRLRADATSGQDRQRYLKLARRYTRRAREERLDALYLISGQIIRY